MGNSKAELLYTVGFGKGNRSLNSVVLGEQEAYGRSTAGGGGHIQASYLSPPYFPPCLVFLFAVFYGCGKMDKVLCFISFFCCFHVVSSA